METKFARFVLGTAIALASPLAPLRAQFAYVANLTRATTSRPTASVRRCPDAGPRLALPRGPSPASVAVDPSGRLAYVVNDSDVPEVPGTISAFTIGSSGAFTPVPGSPFPAGDTPDSVVVDPTGRFAYVVNVTVSGQSGAISAFSIGPHGPWPPLRARPLQPGHSLKPWPPTRQASSFNVAGSSAVIAFR